MRGRLGLRIDRLVGAVVACRAIAGGDRACRAAVRHRGRSKRRVDLVAGIALRRGRDGAGGLGPGVWAGWAGSGPGSFIQLAPPRTRPES